MFAKRSSLVAAACIALAATAAPAQEAPIYPPYRQPAPRPAAQPVAPPQPQGVLTAASLGALLDQLGYERQAVQGVNRVEHVITVKRPTCTIRATAFVNKDRSQVCIATRLPTDLNTELPGAATHFLRLMEKNVEMAPTMFAADLDGHLWILRQLPNAGLTPARVREALDQYLSAIEDTMWLWQSPKRPADPADDAQR
jgi:hypothetical protein